MLNLKKLKACKEEDKGVEDCIELEWIQNSANESEFQILLSIFIYSRTKKYKMTKMDDPARLGCLYFENFTIYNSRRAGLRKAKWVNNCNTVIVG